MNKETILVIQKDEKSAYLLDFILSREGYDVIAITGCKGVRQLLDKISAPQLIILDLNLSAENNNEIFSLIKNKPSWLDIPVLLLATEYRHREIISALDAGASDFIVRPFAHSELIGQIERHAQLLH